MRTFTLPAFTLLCLFWLQSFQSAQAQIILDPPQLESGFVYRGPLPDFHNEDTLSPKTWFSATQSISEITMEDWNTYYLEIPAGNDGWGFEVGQKDGLVLLNRKNLASNHSEMMEFTYWKDGVYYLTLNRGDSVRTVFWKIRHKKPAP